MKKLISVTQEDIDKGHPGRACDCPVALALNRTFGRKLRDRYRFSVTRFKIYDGGNKSYPTPDVVHNFIVAFDAEHISKPFSFELDIID